MKLRLCFYFIKQAITSIFHNRMVHMIGTATMVISLLIFGAFLFMFVNINTWVQGWGHSLSMSVYLEDGIEESRREAIASTIKGLSGAEIKRFISKEAALRDLKQALGDGVGLITEMSRNPLPASFEVVFTNIDSPGRDPERIKNVLEKQSGVSEVQYSSEWLKQFEGLMDVVWLMGVIIGGLLGVGVLFIMTNTIKLTIYSRKHEIEIKKLVGATDWFVKAPFLLEGVIQGALSGGISLLLLYLAYLFFAGRPVQFLDLAVLDFRFLPSSYIFVILLISIFLGLAGSLIAVGRFIAKESFIEI